MKTILFITLIFGAVAGLTASDYADNDILYERIWFATDRDVYIAGDEVKVSLASIDGMYQVPVDFSKVAYLELFSDDYFAVAQEKAVLSDGRGAVTLQIPKDMKTGYYYLRAYSNFQKNFGEHSFQTKKLRIVNPFVIIPYASEPEPEKSDSLISGVRFSGDSLFITFADSLVLDMQMQVQCNGVPLINELTSYSTNTYFLQMGDYKGFFDLEISLNDSMSQSLNLADYMPAQVDCRADSDSVQYAVNAGIDTAGIYSLSVIHEGHRPFADTYVQPSGKVKFPDVIKYKPELEEDLIFGTVEVPEQDEMPNFVIVSQPGRYDFLKAKRVAIDGSFCVRMADIDDSKPVVITASDSLSRIKLDVEQEFYSEFSKVEPEKYYPEKWLGPYIKSLMVNVQIKDAMNTGTKEEIGSSSLFYGQFDEHLVFDKFITLPSMEEYIHELMPSVYVRKKRKRKYIRLSDYDFRGFVGDKPLMLIDGTPYFDHSTVLDLPPKQIDKVMIVNHKLSYLNVKFDGVLDIRTKDGYSETIDLPHNAISINFISAKRPYNYQGEQLVDNILFWDPYADNLNRTKFAKGLEDAGYKCRLQGLQNGKFVDVYSESFSTK